MSELTRTTLAIEQDLLKKFDTWMGRHGFTNRSQAMREMIRSAIVEDQWSNPKSKVIATLSLIFDHSSHTLAQEITSLQHEDHHAILCSQHVHLDHDLCLEVISMRGTAGQLRRICDTIIATRGVRAGKLTLMSTKV